jgi:hypothetical protein
MGQLEKDHGASEFLKVSAIKRFGQPEEIAVVLAFCAGEAPGYLTGTDILVDGGTRAGQEFRKEALNPADVQRSGPVRWPGCRTPVISAACSWLMGRQRSLDASCVPTILPRPRAPAGKLFAITGSARSARSIESPDTRTT